jgi:lysophospholipase L1-like esterase
VSRSLLAPFIYLLFPFAAPSEPARPIVLVAFGDSTTALRKNLEVYPTLLEKELPSKGIQAKVFNAGVGGNSTNDARLRFQKDVLDHNPDVVILQFGINDSAVDVWKQPPADQPRVPLKQYEINLRYFITVLKKRRVSVFVMTPNPLRWTPRLKELYSKAPYEPENPNGMNHLLKVYAESTRKVARTEKVMLVDVAKSFEDYAHSGRQSLDDLLLDGMHPNQQGHRMIAGLLGPRIAQLLERESFGKTTARKN